jgi:two-component system phosphate regulon sensor histidine kinase PhoR
MMWLLPRLGKLLLALAGGAVLGLVLGTLVGHPGAGAALGAMAGASALVVADAWRGQRLLAWLRDTQQDPAPRDTGFWGELGYRIERAFRTRERAITDERGRLAQFLSAMEASPNGVLLLDAGEQIEWCNSVAALHFALNPGRDRLQRVTNLVRSPAFKAYLTEGRFDEAVVFTGPDGRTTLSVLVRPYGDELKLVLSQDITERERTEAMRRDFVANVSHEIRTPLTVLAGFVETMGSLPLSGAERQRVLELMAQQTDRMQTLVADLLTLATLEGSPRPAPDRWVSVAGLMQRAEADARSLSGGRHAMGFEGGRDIEIAGSDGELHSAIGNLLTNAVRYTPEGGRIDVRWADRADGGGQLEVADNGIGVAREHLPRLTERFYRVDGSRSRETGGTGLGLSIVKHVMQRHGGTIEVDSDPGRGSRFLLVFPPSRLRASASAVKGPSAATLT